MFIQGYLPYSKAGLRLPGMIGNLPTHADEVIAALLRFMAWPAA